MAEQLAKEQAEETRKMTEAEKTVRASKKALKDAEAAKEAVQVSMNAIADKTDTRDGHSHARPAHTHRARDGSDRAPPVVR